MIYPRDFEKKVEFDVIRKLLHDNCFSPMGMEYVEKMKFETQFKKIDLLLDQTSEFKKIIEEGKSFPSTDFYDLRQELHRISTAGTYIFPDHLFDLKSTLESITEIIRFIQNNADKNIPRILHIADRIYIDQQILQMAVKIIDDRGEIKNTASAVLQNLRKRIAEKEKAADKKIAQKLKEAKKSGLVADDVEIAIRDGRQVIPLPASHKRQIQGLILDESSTGQTVFLEPKEVLEINNEIRELKGAERREIIKILKGATDELRPFIPDLLNAYQELGLLDFIRAKAKLANTFKGIKPNLNENSGFNWIHGVHPILFINHQKQNKNVVPLDILLDKENRVLVISGPNAGGKSVCLKTVGILQYMLQCGLLIPVEEGSVSGIFKNIFIDIGDEQSLENDLSTYSSHLLNMKNLVLNGDENTLFLIDEFGTGTEPQLGGAIAESILEKLNELGCYGVVTTHYSNLKLLAKQGNGIINGAMLFDTNIMEPLYQLVIGKPGSSFAFEIARKIGFPKILLKNAEKKTGKKQLDFDQQLQQLEIEKNELDKKKQEFEVADKFLVELTDKYENLKNDLEDKKNKIISDAREEAFQLLQSSNKLIEHTIKEIRESQAEKEKTQKLRKEMWEEKEKIKKQMPDKKKNAGQNEEEKSGKKETQKSQEIKLDGKIRTGDFIKIPEQEISGEVLSVSGDEVIIGFNNVKFKTQLNKVEKINPKKMKKQLSDIRKTVYSGILEDLNDKLTNFNFQLDVRGMRGEDALLKVKQYIDDALLLNIREVKILHGKGHGILRSLIHDYLKTLSEIKQFKDEHIERGGHGITLVILK
ncbi:MAG: Smr/MutS family protein [Bacteroidales bacterium]|nr:Smr/MutS family protein [Bacteroidales bacterium]MCF8403594.1 Smr/MutS family protein [Bacteroidales bacterium]